MAARIDFPAQVKQGEVVRVRLIIQHAMETGYRHDETGKPVAKNVIRQITCRYGGVAVFQAATSPGIAANPYFEFNLVARASGPLEVEWRDDAGATGTATKDLVVV